MKEKDLIVDCPYQQVILYAEKSDGTYGPIQTGSYMAGTHISEHYKITGDLIQSLLSRLKEGSISPVYYYMMIEGLTVPDLAARVKISKARVSRHLTPSGFKKIRISVLKRYADVLNIPVANFFQVITTAEDRNWNAGFQEDLYKERTFHITQKATGNPLLVETKILENRK